MRRLNCINSVTWVEDTYHVDVSINVAGVPLSHNRQDRLRQREGDSTAHGDDGTANFPKNSFEAFMVYFTSQTHIMITSCKGCNCKHFHKGF